MHRSLILASLAMLASTSTALAQRAAALELGYVSFSDSTAPWTQASLALSGKSSSGTLIARLTAADRFSTSGVQFELEAYPRLSSDTYAYVDVGRSTSAIFPEWRMGGELFTALPHATEASFGLRRLQFAASTVTLWTGSVGVYRGNYWFSARPYVRPASSGASVSGELDARRYAASADDYVGIRLGAGSAPTDRLTETDLARTRSVSAALLASHPLGERLLGTASAGMTREELGAGRTRSRAELNAGVRVTF